MEECLVAAVRAEHVASLKGRAEHMGRVQLGASDAAMFSKLQSGIGSLTVYLFPTTHKAPGTPDPPNYSLLSGVLDAISDEPDPSLRPDATSSDTDFKVYWTVRAQPKTKLSDFSAL